MKQRAYLSEKEQVMAIYQKANILGNIHHIK